MMSLEYMAVTNLHAAYWPNKTNESYMGMSFMHQDSNKTTLEGISFEVC